MNSFQGIESGKGFLKDNYEDPNKKREASLWLEERLKTRKDKIKDQLNEVK